MALLHYIGIWPQGYFPSTDDVIAGNGALLHYPDLPGTLGVEVSQLFSSLSSGTYNLEAAAVDGADVARSLTEEVVVQAAPVEPIWGTINTQTYNKANLPDQLDMKQFIQSNGGSPITSYRDVSPIANVSLNTSTGVYDINAAIALGQYSLQTGATNAEGEGISSIWALDITLDPTPPVGGYADRESFVGSVINWDAKGGWQSVTDSGWSATGLPTGLSMQDNGFVTGTADTEGSWPGIVVTYNDGQAWNADPFQWDVLPAPVPSEGSGSNTLAIAIRIGL